MSGADSNIDVYKLPLRLRSETNRREHWTSRHKRAKHHRELMRSIVKRRPAPLHIKFTRVGRRNLDDDNLRESFKHLRDGIAENVNGLSDNNPVFTWEYEQVVDKQYGIIIEVKYGG